MSDEGHRPDDQRSGAARPTPALAALDAAGIAHRVIKHGLAVAVAADEVLLALDAIVADVSDLEPAPSTRR